MTRLTVVHPVYTLDNQLLFSAGDIVTEETLDDLLSSRMAAPSQSHSILTYGSIKEDLLDFLCLSPFPVIFNTEEKIGDILSIMGQVTLSLPFLRSLDYFREHDLYTYRHILVVFALSTLLAKDLMTDYRSQIQYSATSPSHDIGKVCVPLPILRKSSPLTKTERAILLNHTTAGYVLSCFYLRDSRNITALVSRDHHERRDGSGHPRGILLDNPIIEIIAVCDVYDALISPRPYRPVSFDNRTALEEITSMAEGGQFSWPVVKALIAHNRKDKMHFSECPVSSEKRGNPPSDNIYGLTAEEEHD